jgi:putative ABC transport system permease protein
MKFLGYIVRNARRNPVRSLLTIASITVCLFLMMILFAFISINKEVSSSLRVYNRMVTMSSQGFGKFVPIVRVREIGAMDGVVAVSPMNWFGGKYHNETMPFAQFGIDPKTIFQIMEEYKIPPAELAAFQKDLNGCVVGRKLAQDRNLKVGDPLPIQADTYPFDLDLTIRGIYDGPSNRDLRMCFFHWDYLDKGLQKETRGARSADAGIVYWKCKDSAMMPKLAKKIDDLYRNSDTPTRSLTEEAFNLFFAEMFGDMRLFIQIVGLVVAVSLILVAGNAMAMAMRERVTEVAVLKAIGFDCNLVMWLVLAESILVAGMGGVLGSFGSKLLFDSWDLARHTAGFLPFFYVPVRIALWGVAASLVIGLASGFIPAVRSSRLSVIDGLRKVA